MKAKLIDERDLRRLAEDLTDGIYNGHAIRKMLERIIDEAPEADPVLMIEGGDDDDGGRIEGL